MNAAKILRPLTPVIGVVALVLVWAIAHTLKVADPVLLPSPGETFGELWKGLFGGDLAHDAWITVERTLYSFAIALAIGVPLGVVLGAKIGRAHV